MYVERQLIVVEDATPELSKLKRFLRPGGVADRMKRRVIKWGESGCPTLLSSPARRAVELSIHHYDIYFDQDSGMVMGDVRGGLDPRSAFLCAIALLLSEESERKVQGRDLLRTLARMENGFDTSLTLLALYKADTLLDEEMRDGLRESLRRNANWDGEDIIAGRNINIPLGTWTRRIAAGVLFGRQDLLNGGVRALEALVDLVKTHGTIPEFNSPTYHPITLMLLRIICLLGEERTSRLAGMLEHHLWEEMAWRWHPRLKVLCGPWSRAYQDSMVGSSGMVQILADIAWGAFYDESVAYRYRHGHDYTFGGAFALLMNGHPVDVERIALRKELPLTVTASAEQVAFRFGSGSKSTWVPGGIANLTTWMDENIAVGTSSRPHIHGLQGAGYVAHWARKGNPVEKLSDLGQAFTKFVQNGRRPGSVQPHSYENHHFGQPYKAWLNLWPENGLSYALQSGPTALVTYVPKSQERWTVRRLEGMMVFPRLDTIDRVLLNDQRVEEYLGSPEGWVLVQSGRALAGLRFDCCDHELADPELFVERKNDHLFVGLRVLASMEDRELSEHEYRRFGVSIGADVRYAPSGNHVNEFLTDLRESEISDTWPMALFGGPRVVSFRIGKRRLSGRLDPVSGTWLKRTQPRPRGTVKRVSL